MNIEKLIQNLGPGPCYHLHIEFHTYDPQKHHRQMAEEFNQIMNSRTIRRQRPIYLRLTNIEDHTDHSGIYGRGSYIYIVDILSPCLALLCDLCATRSHRTHPRIYTKEKIKLPQLLKCFHTPVDLYSDAPGCFVLGSKMHPITLMCLLLEAYPKSIDNVTFGLTHTIHITPFVDIERHAWNADKMPFAYKRITRHQPITFTYDYNK